ncbi:MAG TPA: NUDIX domain-containing protein [Candidatus Nanoarchaeia archaeon]|nr:NUDIX domain-containing protein [Candidatus Nanoarchaeia archaeon]
MEDEILDLVNEEDKVVGKISREEMIKNGLPKGLSIRVVNILLFNNEDELLVPQRSDNRRMFPGRYDFSCGEHVKASESYLDAAKRGMEEELGLKLNLKEIEKLGPKDGVSSFMKIYSANYNFPILKYDKEGIKELRWRSLSELEDIMAREPEVFKPDLPIVIKYYINSKNLIKKQIKESFYFLFTKK